MQSYKLITEQPNYDIEFITEEQNRSAEKKMFAVGDLFMVNEVNRNHRRYMEDDMVPEINRYLDESINVGRGVGELNHSSKPDIDLDRIAHKIVSLERDDKRPNFFRGKCQILDTPLGRTLRTLTESSVVWGFSSKALGQLEESGNSTIVRMPQIVSVDAVFEPSIGQYSKGILENREYIIGDDGRVAEAYAVLDKKLSRYPSKHSDEIRAYIVENLQKFLAKI